MENSTQTQKITDEIGKVGNLGLDLISKEFSKEGVSYNLVNFAVSNFIVLFILIMIVIFIFIGYSQFKSKKKKNNKKKRSGTIDISYVDDETNINRTPLKTKDQIEGPIELNRYSYMFNLIIDDFYCNKGTWKCIMLNGDLGDKDDFVPKPCKEFTLSDERKVNSIIKIKDECYKYICKKESEEYKNSLDKDTLDKDTSDNFAKRIYETDSLEDRVELICQAIRRGDVGKKLLACGMSKCGQINGKDMLLGHASSFIDNHEEYCNQVYTPKQKISTDNKLYSDQFDNKCSNKQLMAKYPHLIPSNNALKTILNSEKLKNSGQLNRDDIDKYDDYSFSKKNNDNIDSSDNCWNDLVKNIRAQSPGIWLHPFINNLRIIITTFTEKDFEEEKDKYNFSHILNITGNFKNKKSFREKVDTDCFLSPSDLCSNNMRLLREEDTKLKIYREYFDIENIPIKELFHFTIVLNENTCEVYINSKLVKTQILFGSPNYIKGNIYLNPDLTGKNSNNLNGKIMDFKFINRLVNHFDIKNISSNQTSIEDSNEKINVLNEEHEHDLKHVHSHKFHHDNTSHEHTLEEIPTEH
tara:strand:+ start:6653 stop:8398 length:1746 start_codon:yes stop_codon:yes gene_type:complete